MESVDLRMSRAAYAKYIGKTRARVTQLVNQGMPIGDDNLIDSEEADAWRAEHVRKYALVGGKKDALWQAKVRQVEARAEKLELENQVRSGELLERTDIVRAWGGRARVTRDKLRVIPDRMALILASEGNQHTIRELLRDEIDDALREISEAQVPGVG